MSLSVCSGLIPQRRRVGRFTKPHTNMVPVPNDCDAYVMTRHYHLTLVCMYLHSIGTDSDSRHGYVLPNKPPGLYIVSKCSTLAMSTP